MYGGCSQEPYDERFSKWAYQVDCIPLNLIHLAWVNIYTEK